MGSAMLDTVEYRWLVLEEARKLFPVLLNVIRECEQKLPLSMRARQDAASVEKFMITNPSSSEIIKCVLSLLGDNIVQAELTVRYPKSPGHVYKGTVQPESQWKLQQLQDVCNYVQHAKQLTEFALDNVNAGTPISGMHLVEWIDEIFKHLYNAQSTLLVPKKRSIGDMQHTKALRAFLPPLPTDLVPSFYVSAYKIVCAVYHLQQGGPGRPLRYIIHQGECSVPWLNEALVFLGLALQRCQDGKNRLDTHHRRIVCNPAIDKALLHEINQDDHDDDGITVMHV